MLEIETFILVKTYGVNLPLLKQTSLIDKEHPQHWNLISLSSNTLHINTQDCSLSIIHSKKC